MNIRSSITEEYLTYTTRKTSASIHYCLTTTYAASVVHLLLAETFNLQLENICFNSIPHDYICFHWSFVVHWTCNIGHFLSSWCIHNHWCYLHPHHVGLGFHALNVCELAFFQHCCDSLGKTDNGWISVSHFTNEWEEHDKLSIRFIELIIQCVLGEYPFRQLKSLQ